MFEMVASTLVVTGVVALVAALAAGRPPPLVISFLNRCRCPRPPAVLLVDHHVGRPVRLSCPLQCVHAVVLPISLCVAALLL